MGSLEATDELARLTHMNKDSYILDVGTGVGITPCYLAKKYDLKAVGVDINEKMVERAKDRAVFDGVSDKVEFFACDMHELPFEDVAFDVVICESVVAFAHDKAEVLKECARVTKVGGYVGLNETTWLTPDVPSYIKDYFYNAAGGVISETQEG
ncbi:MAG: class I SAM-dependent methyltransferase [Actinomycetota bacterium]|nr:class I SAM-dependent methyltransferase [Actinomycetota bacterium]